MRSTTRASSDVLEAALLRRGELVVDDEHLRLRVRERRFQLLELALADVRARVRSRRGAGRARRPARAPRCARARGARRAPQLRAPAAGTRRRTRALRLLRGPDRVAGGSPHHYAAVPTARGKPLALPRARLARPRGADDVSVRHARAGEAGDGGAGHRDHRLRAGRPARADRSAESAKHWQRASPRRWRIRRRRGCPSSARRSPAGAVGGSASLSTLTRELIPTLRQQGGDLQLRPGRARSSTAAKDTVLVPDPAYPVYERGAEFAGARVERASAARGERLPAGSRRDLRARRSLARRWSGSTIRTTRRRPWPRRRSSTTSRDSPKSTTSSSARTRPTASSGSTSLRRRRSALADRSPRRRLQHAQQALVDDRLPVGLRRRPAVARRRAQEVPADRGHGAAGVRPARIDRRVGRRGARGAARDSVPAQAGRPAPRARSERLARRREGRDDVPLALRCPAGESSEHAAARLLEHGIVVAPGSYLGRHGEGYVRLALVPTVEDCERAARILEDAL